MFLIPDARETEIADTAARFVSRVMPLERFRAADAAPDLGSALRAELAALGWFGIALAEADGGIGLSAVEHALFFREVGRNCGPVDILAQGLAAMLASDAGMVAALLAGKRGTAFAVGDGGELRVLGSRDSGLALHLEGGALRLLDLSSCETTTLPSLDPATGMRRVVAGVPRLVATSSSRDVWRLGQLGIAAMQVGVAERALDLIVAYAKVRETFGRKIGAHQAVRHACADMALRAEAARCQLWSAAAAIKERRSDAQAHLDAAQHLANRAALANADADIQLHGGIGVTREHQAPLLLKHALLLARLFGSRREILARLLDAEIEG